MDRIALPSGWPVFARTGPKKTDLIDKIQDAAVGRAQLEGAMLGPAYLACDDGATIKIGPIARAMLGNANVTLKTTAETAYTPTSPALSSATRYHLFARNNAGALAFEHTAAIDAVPDGSLTFKYDGMTVDETRRYLGTFATQQDTAAIFWFWRGAGRHYLYDACGANGIDSGHLTALSPAGNVAFQTVALLPWLPAHARVVWLAARYQYGGAGASEHRAWIKRGGASGDVGHFLLAESSGGITYKTFPLVLSDTLAIQWKTENSSDQLTIDVLGFEE